VTPALGTPASGVMTNMTGAVSASIGNDQIDSQHYAADSIDTEHYAPASVDTTAMAASIIGVKPHIIPGVLYPAVAGKLLDGTTSHGATYGVAQADGYSYYYTDIKGSKPIKDPRIGAHFGSQRHYFTSGELLEEETATHGSNVYSIDGRENMRMATTQTRTALFINNTQGSYYIQLGWADTEFYEVTGYFNNINMLGLTWNATSYGVKYSINGAAFTTASDDFNAVQSPLINRCVRNASLLNLPVSATLGLNTVKISMGGACFGIELIAQDTTSTATKSQIQIPSQNVVSYGKKFTVSGTPHYNPFAYAGDGTTAVAIGDTTSHGKVATGWTGSTSAYFDSTLDTATSLGLSAWETGGDFYRPVNGGRVVRWVDSSGNIKTSVNMMPPCATAITAGSDASLPTSHAWTTVYQPKIKSGAIDHSQAEVAKTFHWREFGNGAANAGTGGTYADASMLSAADDIAYVMDDGLTSLSGHANQSNSRGSVRWQNAENDSFLFTFIGTGFSYTGNADMARNVQHNTNLAQNLPYGTHVVKFIRTASSNCAAISIDGVLLITTVSGTNDELAGVEELTFHQPKMPPIPEDAVVIADYMLMADFVPQTASAVDKISKGVRKVDCTRDIFYDESDGDSIVLGREVNFSGGSAIYLSGPADSDTSMTMRIPSFGTNYVHRGYQSDTRVKLFIDTTDNDSSATKDNTAGYGSYAHLTTDLTLGVYKFGANAASGLNAYTSSFEVATPIHTSSHYQTFETPFLHELVGGDRNMEQTNLVVTPDGKSWDEVTRDVSYIGKCVLVAEGETPTHVSDSAILIFDEWRGAASTYKNRFNKDFAIAYDRLICLVNGQYEIALQTISATVDHGGNLAMVYVNGVYVNAGYSGDDGFMNSYNTISLNLKRSDYIQVYGDWHSSNVYSGYKITKL
jgi:hypothetical protein